MNLFMSMMFCANVGVKIVRMYSNRLYMNVEPMIEWIFKQLHGWIAYLDAWDVWNRYLFMKKHYFSCFRTIGTARHRFHTVRRQVPDFWVLGATNFSSLRNFCKTAFCGSLTVWFSWNFDRWRFELEVCS